MRTTDPVIGELRICPGRPEHGLNAVLVVVVLESQYVIKGQHRIRVAVVGSFSKLVSSQAVEIGSKKEV